MLKDFCHQQEYSTKIEKVKQKTIIKPDKNINILKSFHFNTHLIKIELLILQCSFFSFKNFLLYCTGKPPIVDLKACCHDCLECNNWSYCIGILCEGLCCA